ncbi:endonuclease/exonuclease/phosphatase family protein [Alteromonas oceanisediminis]|uniref:endonuclease/exonuclease/phosphatase family protein n=1 Tax=Alteromonas oceanisediminis TaxID=2836180 RepID=UPI001BDA3D3C|nr:endonuclease/exonuclease/phosphatase family protein [Alteromonas oceanisediminis]
MRYIGFLIAFIPLISCSYPVNAEPKTAVKFAAFNVSMEAQNYAGELEKDGTGATQIGPELLIQHLATGKHAQIRNIAEIIQRVAPDVILLNEFDYIENPDLGINAFQENYLAVSQNGNSAITYDYIYYAPSNTGLPTTFDLDNNGKREQFGADAQGYGLYTGHYAMVLLSKFPILTEQVRTFQRFLWSDMPNALRPFTPESNTPFHSELEWKSLRLSSKSHWDVPIDINGQKIHVLASHPTPPVFDGPEDRNGKRNHDEIRFWLDYVTPGQGNYIYDARGLKGGLEDDASFVILGDQNASPDRPNETPQVIVNLLSSPQVNNTFTPTSEAGKQNRPDNASAKFHTASWGARADYVIPSKQLKIANGGVFWPSKDDPLYRLVKDRQSSSDHRLVWLTLAL